MPGGLSKPLWGQKTFCLLTGASQGIGRRFAVEFARKFAPDSVLLLMARSAQGLEETKTMIGEVNVNVQCHSIDLAKADSAAFHQIIQDSLSKVGVVPSDFSLAFIIHNAGSLGTVGPGVAEISDTESWNDNFALNVTSVAVLNAVFLKVFPEGSVPQRTVVNVTSLCAVQPFSSMGQYCVGKAAREMFFKVLAEENASLDVLNYSPGPVDTDMTITIIQNTRDAKTRQSFIEMKEKKTIVTCEQTTQKIIDLLANKKYKSGQRVDYFDEGY